MQPVHILDTENDANFEFRPALIQAVRFFAENC
jgi:hypothetical protein